MQYSLNDGKWCFVYVIFLLLDEVTFQRPWSDVLRGVKRNFVCLLVWKWRSGVVWMKIYISSRTVQARSKRGTASKLPHYHTSPLPSDGLSCNWRCCWVSLLYANSCAHVCADDRGNPLSFCTWWSFLQATGGQNKRNVCQFVCYSYCEGTNIFRHHCASMLAQWLTTLTSFSRN